MDRSQTIDPTAPRSVEELEDVLSRPPERVVEALAAVEGDIAFLGVGGKMGPTMARMALRASRQAGSQRRVIGVSRFTSPGVRAQLEQWGIETCACDLMDERAVASLPDVPWVVYLSGMKFGAASDPSLTWAMNCYAPAVVCQKYRHSRLVAFSTGNVYGMVPPSSGGSLESDAAEPIGEYAMTALGRERMFQYFSQQLGIPTILLRLNYATELRYGVLVDLAELVRDERTVDVTMGYVNVIWLGDANAMTLCALPQAGEGCQVVNLAGSEILAVREVGEQLGRLMQRTVRFCGREASRALLSNASHGYRLMGYPQVDAQQMIRWTADWVGRGGESLGKPTHFEVRDGKY